jgi:glycosyltransferase involved in cell wall biosynthesis
MARRRWRRHGPRLRRADAVIAVSRHVADRTIQRFGLDPARVHVVHHGVDPGFRPAPGRELSDPPYLLFVAAWGPHKGHAEAVEVVARLADAGYPHRLKIVGYEDAWMAARVRDVVGRGRHPERVDVVGWADELPALYQRATALVLTSRAEGFGLPAVEAMACGTPVVAFANTSLPEVVGDGGALVADGDVDAFVRDVRVLLDDERAWQEASARALARAARFDWGQSVAAHAEILRAVAEGHHR